jgi:hypothetical protein
MLGDGGRLAIGADHLNELRQTCSKYEQEVGTSVSVGIGAKLSESELALEYAMLTGGGIELFRKELPQEIQELKENPKSADTLANFLDKAEPPLNTPAAGGGMTGPSMSGPAGAEPPMDEGSEHSENEALGEMLDGQPPAAQPPDLAGQFTQLAQQSEGREQQAKDQQQAEQQQAQDSENMRGEIVKILKQFQSMGPLWEQLKQAQPKAYKSLADMMQVMIALARQVYGGDEGQEQQQPQQEGQPVQKSEQAPLHSTVEGFMTQLKGLPKDGPHRGKFITQHMNHGPFLAALQAHPQGKQVHATLTNFLNSKANAGPANAQVVAKKDLMPGGKGDNRADDEFDDDALEVGVRTEMDEHGLDSARAKEIAKDHLTEDSGYYKKDAISMGPKSPLVYQQAHAKKPGTTGRFSVRLPVRSQIDPGASAGRNVGRVKVLDPESNTTKWREVRAGQVMGADGQPASSRNPGAGSK